MQNKKWLIAWVLALALVGVLMLAGILSAQSNLDFTGILEPQPGDADVVLTVEGIEATRKDLRMSPDFMRNFNPEIAEDEALKQTIVSKVNELVIQAEVQRLGLTPTLAEAREFMAPSKEWCQGPEGTECQELIRALGEDPQSDEYWNKALPTYRNDLGRLKLIDHLEAGWESDIASGVRTNESVYTFEERELTLHELRGDADITWHDKRLEGLYEQALTLVNEAIGVSETPVAPGTTVVPGPTGPVGSTGETGTSGPGVGP